MNRIYDVWKLVKMFPEIRKPRTFDARRLPGMGKVGKSWEGGGLDSLLLAENEPTANTSTAQNFVDFINVANTQRAFAPIDAKGR